MGKYRFSDKEREEIRLCREHVQTSKADRRLEAIQLRAEGKRNKEISAKTGFHVQYITTLVSRYKSAGIESVLGKRYPQKNRNAAE